MMLWIQKNNISLFLITDSGASTGDQQVPSFRLGTRYTGTE